jgi:predicted DNA-binding protein YlxM (UPF0122 family)
MDDIIYYNELYDIYGKLLTEKQRLYFEDYYFNNLSFSEIAENNDVSRNAAFKQLHIVVDKLEEFEKNVGYLKKRKKIMELLRNNNVSSDIISKIDEVF